MGLRVTVIPDSCEAKPSLILSVIRNPVARGTFARVVLRRYLCLGDCGARSLRSLVAMTDGGVIVRHCHSGQLRGEAESDPKRDPESRSERDIRACRVAQIPLSGDCGARSLRPLAAMTDGLLRCDRETALLCRKTRVPN
jgi:hypothetical protein